MAGMPSVKPPLPFTVVEMLDFTGWRGARSDNPWPRLEMAARTLAARCSRGARRAFGSRRRRRRRRLHLRKGFADGTDTAHGEAAPGKVAHQRVKALVAREDHALCARRRLQQLAEVKRDVEVERVLALALDVDRNESIAQPPRDIEQ